MKRPPPDIYLVKPPREENAKPGGWETKVLVTKAGGIRACASNVMHIAQGHPAVRGRLAYDSRSLTPSWSDTTPWGAAPRPWQDHDGHLASQWIADEIGVAIEPGTVEGALLAVARCHSYDPVEDYLGALAWDGVARLDDWLTTYLGVEPSGYVTAVGRAWLISVVARGLRPGCKADHMLVLEGPQGARKSSALAALAGDEHFAELAIDVADKDSYLAIHGPWIIEWAELVGHNRRESEAVKAFLSRRVDRLRVPYGRVTENHPRKCVFVGTTNDRQYLGDPTGGRRYWPVAVGEVDCDAVTRDRDQLWAEAVVAFRAGEPWWLTGSAEESAREEQLARLEQDPWDELVEDQLERGSLSSTEFATIADVLSAIGVAGSIQHSGHARRIGRIMAQLGWQSGIYQGRRGFERPEVV